MDKTKELFGLHKVPDKAIIKELLKEKGQLLSYIDELKYENEQLRKQIKEQKL
ncbi:MAG: hypothetical protein ACRDDZ_01365 [Marinifilaceae bacterium]